MGGFRARRILIRRRWQVMIQNDRDPRVEPFPTKLIGIAALTTLAVFAWLSWFVYDEYQIVQDKEGAAPTDIRAALPGSQ